jgi:hypothetical protein
MSQIEHLAELSRRHADLERKLEETTLHPSTDSLEVSRLKRQKLQIKDEIARLQSEATVH